MDNPLLKPTPPTANPEDSEKMLKPHEEAEQKILSFKIRGAKGPRFAKFAAQLKHSAKMAGLDIIHAELKSAGKEPFGGTLDITNIDPTKLQEPGFKEGPLGPKVKKPTKSEMSPGKLSPEELEKMGYNKSEWERMTKDDVAAQRAAKQARKKAGLPPEDDEDEV